MGKRIKCKALVLNSVSYSESSKMLTAISDEFGKISISAKGASKPGSPFIACAQNYCYSNMELSEGRNGIYTLCECELISSFYSIRESLEISDAAYLVAHAVLTVSQEENPDEDLLRLALNTFYALSNVVAKIPKDLDQETFDKELAKRIEFITNVFYIRLASDQGFFDMPETFRDPSTEKAVIHIVSCDLKALFAFSLGPKASEELLAIAIKARNDVLE